MQFKGVSVIRSRIFTVAVAAVVTSGLAGCTVVVRDRPPHAPRPAVVDSVYFEYYYYPSVGVYYHFDTGYYYYYSKRRWIRTRYLPSHIHLHRDDRVRLRLKDRTPYLRHEEHRRTYKPTRRYRFEERHDRDEREFHRREYRGSGGLKPEPSVEPRGGLKEERIEERRERRSDKERYNERKNRDNRKERERNREEKDREYDKENPGRGDERRDRFQSR